MINFEPNRNNYRATIATANSDQIADKGHLENSGIINAFSNVPELTATYSLNAYANQLKITNLLEINRGGIPPINEENYIKEFTPDSRRRLFDLITSLDYPSYGKPIFVSATWHEDFPGTRHDIKTFLDSYHKRLKRNLPPFHLIWKLEYQKRRAPHFHFIIFPLDSSYDFNTIKDGQIIYRNWMALKACKCIHCQTYAMEITPLNDFLHTVIYISKELGKVTQNEQHHNLGRIWGSSRNMHIRIYKTVEINFQQLSALLQTVCNQNELTPKLEIIIQAIRAFGFSSKIFIPYELIRLLLLEHERNYIQPKRKMKSITISRMNFIRRNNVNSK
jgi:hypothetical protein